MLSKLLPILAGSAMAVSYEIADTCINRDTPLYGHFDTDVDTAFTDYDYLLANEENGRIYRMAFLTLCSDANDNFIGMRSIVGKYDAETFGNPHNFGTNMIGSVPGGPNCARLGLDAPGGEYLSSLTMAYFPGSNEIEYMKAESSQGRTLEKGSKQPGMSEQVMRSEEPHQIVAFWGYESNRVAAIAAVNSNSTCIKGVTSVEVSDEIPYTEIIDTQEEMKHVVPGSESGSGLTKNEIIGYSAGGAFAAILVVGLIFAIVFLWRTRCRSVNTVSLPKEVFNAPIATIDTLKMKDRVTHFEDPDEKNRLSNVHKSDEDERVADIENGDSLLTDEGAAKDPLAASQQHIRDENEGFEMMHIDRAKRAGTEIRRKK